MQQINMVINTAISGVKLQATIEGDILILETSKSHFIIQPELIADNMGAFGTIASYIQAIMYDTEQTSRTI